MRRKLGVMAAMLCLALLSGCFAQAINDALDALDAQAPTNDDGAAQVERTSSSAGGKTTPMVSGKPAQDVPSRPGKQTASGPPAFLNPDVFNALHNASYKTLDLSLPMGDAPRPLERPPVANKSGRYIKVESEPYLADCPTAIQIAAYPAEMSDNVYTYVFLCLPGTPADVDLVHDGVLLYVEADKQNMTAGSQWTIRTPEQEGTYELRIHVTDYRAMKSFSDKDAVVETDVDAATFTVWNAADTGVRITTDKPSYHPGEDITITFSGIPREHMENMEIAICDANVGRFGAFFTYNNASTFTEADYASGRFTIKAGSWKSEMFQEDMRRGLYEVRLYTADTYAWNNIAASTQFTIEVPYELGEDFLQYPWTGGEGASDWARDELSAAYWSGLAPKELMSDLQNPVTRGEMVELCARAFRSEGIYEPQVVLPARLDEAITNQEAAVLMQRTLVPPYHPALLGCSVAYAQDVAARYAMDDWALLSVAYWLNWGVIREDRGAYAPKASCTREAAILLAWRAVEAAMDDPPERLYPSAPQKGFDPLLMRMWFNGAPVGNIVDAAGNYITWAGSGSAFNFYADGTYTFIRTSQGTGLRISIIEAGKYRVTGPGVIECSDIAITSESSSSGRTTERGANHALHYVIGADLDRPYLHIVDPAEDEALSRYGKKYEIQHES